MTWLLAALPYFGEEDLARVDMPFMVVRTTPAGFTEALTGQGEAVSWRVLDDPSAPGGKVIAETSGDNADYRFRLRIFDGFTARNVKASVRFKAVDGSADQAAGVVARVQDPENYYVTRANALEANVRLYKVTGGVRRRIASYDGEVTARVWHSLSLKVEGDLLEVEFDGATVIQANDTGISGPGKVGLWTKADDTGEDKPMNRRSILISSTIAALGLALTAGDAAALSENDLVGTWTLVSADQWGPNPKGVMIFDAGGHVAAQLMRSDLPKYKSDNRSEGTPEEYKATVQGMIAFYGTYAVSGTDLLFHYEGCSFPNWIGVDQKRTNVTLNGDDLKWTQPTPSAGGPPAPIVWKRAK